MIGFRFSPLVLLGLMAASSAVAADAPTRVFPASLPLPLPGTQPMPPDRLRAQNPWDLAMTGLWRFRLAHGQIVAGRFVPGAPVANDVAASSYQAENPPENAFDGSADTRWCADGDATPQWLQVDLGRTRRVTGVTLSWERAAETYRCRIEGSTDARRWKTLADASAAPGIGDGPVPALNGDTARYVRVTVLGVSGTSWASIRECQVHVLEGGRDIVWRPQKAAPAAAAHTDDFTRTDFDDRAWPTLAVPSNWEMAGYSLPTYDSVDNTVGLYRRWVTVPASWSGRRVFWRFDGALDGAEVYVNGQKAGYHESGYTAWDIDLTGLVRPGQRNLFALRVSKTTPSFDADTGDFQTMGGVYRDTSLIAVPKTHVSDITVRTPLAPNYRDATLAAIVQVQGTPGATVGVAGNLVGADGRATAVKVAGQGRIGADGVAAVALSAPVEAPNLWSAEKPNLYYLVLQLTSGGKPAERVEQRFGFRQIEVKNDIVLWNGRPIKCTGICRHDFWGDRGFALTEANWVTDLTLMKAANINAIRTSHYNHAARFLELCDEKGMYILDEVPYCWINDQVKDPRYAPFLLQRAQETLARDKNRPCVLAWSLGNENPNGIDSQQVIDLVKRTDPTRPAFVSGQNPDSVKGQGWKDDHYPGPDSVDRDIANPRWVTNYSEHPHTFYEKEAQDYDPGVSDLWSETLIKTWDRLWKAPNILGSFIWEWQSQGIADKNPDKTRDFYDGLDHLRQENNKGVVDSFRHPKAEYWIVKMAYSPVVVGARTVSPSGGVCTVPLTDHYSFTDLSELTCRWTALKGETPLATGKAQIACAPMQSVQASFPAPSDMTALRLEFLKPDGVSVTEARLTVSGAPVPAPPPGLTGGGALAVQSGTNTLEVGNAIQSIVFDKHAGNVQSWRVHGRDVLMEGPTLNLGEAKAGHENGYYYAAQPPVTEGAVVTSQPQPDGAVRVAVTSTVKAGAGGQTLGTLVSTYDVRADAAVAVHWTLNWTGPETHLWEAGLKLSFPAAFSRMAWWRDSYFTAYPAGHLGEPTGISRAGDTLFRSSKRGLHWMSLTDSSGAGLTLTALETPLIARAAPGTATDTLFASEEVAGDRGLSGAWVTDHEITAAPGKPISGGFLLRAAGDSL